MKSSQIPVARKEGLVVQESADEVLVYDMATNKAHCLNQTAASVWKACDGNKSVSQIAQIFDNAGSSAVNEDMVWLALDQLNECNLLESRLQSAFAGSSRRDVIKKVGLAAVVALPIVASLAAPASALASTSCSCAAPGDCLAQTGCPSTVNCNGGGTCAP